jgi:hypothetical protein
MSLFFMGVMAISLLWISIIVTVAAVMIIKRLKQIDGHIKTVSDKTLIIMDAVDDGLAGVFSSISDVAVGTLILEAIIGFFRSK